MLIQVTRLCGPPLRYTKSALRSRPHGLCRVGVTDVGGGLRSRFRTDRTAPSLRFMRWEICRRLSPRARRARSPWRRARGFSEAPRTSCPSARARAIPARVRSRISSRSNSANAASMFRCKRPLGVEVSIPWSMTITRAPAASASSQNRRIMPSDRPSRSIFETTTVSKSPAAIRCRSRSSSGLLSLTPDMPSSRKTRPRSTLSPGSRP